jgi:LPS-assembly lipoprotein
MWWRKLHWRSVLRIAVVLAAAGLAAGCFEPLYGARPASPQSETVRDKLAAVEIAPINALKGTPQERLAVGMHNALQFDLNGNAGPNAPNYRLVINVSQSQWTVVIDPNTGRPDAMIAGVVANYQLIESASGKAVVSESTFAHVDYDVPGPEQRFARQRAQRDAEDRAVQVAAETIRNRLASYFVAGT